MNRDYNENINVELRELSPLEERQTASCTENKLMTDATDCLDSWESEFREAARQDSGASLAAHLQRHGLPGGRDLLLEGTIDFVRASVAYLRLDGQKIEQFLANQRYTPQVTEEACYLVTFDVVGKSYGRLVVSEALKYLDLADLFNHPWWRIELSGYWCFWVARIDAQALSEDEILSLEQTVEADIRFDYDEESVMIMFDSCSLDGTLCVVLDDL